MSDVTEVIELSKRLILSDSSLYNELIRKIDKALKDTTIVWEYWEYSEAAKKIADELLK